MTPDANLPPVPTPDESLDDGLPPIVADGKSIPAAPGLANSGKSPLAFRTISEVASEIGVPQHVLRFWETRFTALKPVKRGGNRRYYRPADVALLKAINKLLYSDGYTIKGVQKLIAEGGIATAGHSISNGAAPNGAAPDATAPVSPASDATPVSQLAAAQNLRFDGAALPQPAISVDALFAIRDRLAGALAEARAA
jgi:DNA-binding transcriptional MerR regulator